MARQRMAEWLSVLLVAVGWIVSLMLPVAIMGESADTIFPGYAILMMGWMGVFVGQFGWFLNLLLWPALVLAASRSSVRQSRKLGLAALMMVLVADALFWRDMYGDDGATPIPVFGTGYYLWFAVMVAACGLLILSGPRAWQGGRSRREGA